MLRDSDQSVATLRVDGGMVVNNWVVQALANILGVAVDRPQITETTALGVAYLAGLQTGIFRDLDALTEHWTCERTFQAAMPEAKREELYRGWQDAVSRVRGH